MNRRAHTAGRAILALVILAGIHAGLTFAQEDKKTSNCRPDELDMGDFCASLRAPETPEESETRRVTPFRAHSMMPGRVEAPATAGAQPEPAPGPAEHEATPKQADRGMTPESPKYRAAPAAPPPRDTSRPAAEAGGRYGVQLGVFSDRATALGVIQPLAERGLPVSLARIEREDHVLWACIHGPFLDRPAAEAAARRLAIDEGIGNTYIKTLDGLELVGITHDATQE